MHQEEDQPSAAAAACPLSPVVHALIREHLSRCGLLRTLETLDEEV